ncbi:MAG TPA: YraN family protein [Terriglobales bacterium]|nr:YraN family protein [Terriglobales bacterium]
MFGIRKSTQDLGRTGELVALKYLRRKGYAIIETRFRFLRGEIDIVARDGDTLVFVEVKMRTGGGFGRPEESVTAEKRRRIRKVAEGYLLLRRPGDVRCRFDVVAIRSGGGTGDIVDHIVNAF